MKWIFVIAVFFGSLVAEAQISASPSFIDFGDVSIDNGWRQTSVWVRNNSNEQTNVHVSNTCFGNFYSYNNCYTLMPYGSCTIQVEFRPRREGYDSCSININGTRGGFTSVNIRGRGVDSTAFEVNAPYAE